MFFAISIWTFLDEHNNIYDLIDYFTERGFNAISLKPENIIKTEKAQLDNILSLISKKKLPVTIHANYDIAIPELEILFQRLGNHLNCISLDPLCRIDSDGAFFPSLDIMPVLNFLEKRTIENNVLFGLEDFPLDHNALNHNIADLSRIVTCERFGILLDIGHSNLRTYDNEYFRKKGLEKYITDIPVPIIELHVHDNNKRADQHMPPGQGNLDFALVAKVLKERKFDNVSTIEVSPRLYDSFPNAEKLPAIKGCEYWRSFFKE